MGEYLELFPPQGSLKRWLQQEGARLNQRRLLSAATDVAAGLRFMHKHQMLHTLVLYQLLLSTSNKVQFRRNLLRNIAVNISN